MQIINHIILVDGQARIRRKPHVKAKMVARMYIWEQQSVEAVMAQYNLTASEVHSAIAYYYDNQAELDAEYDRALAKIGDSAMTQDKFKAKIVARQQQQNDD